MVYHTEGRDDLQPSGRGANPNGRPLSLGSHMYRHKAFAAALLLAALALSACGGGSQASSGTPAVPTPPATTPSSSDRIIVVLMENQDYAAVIGSTSMPYLNGLAQRGGTLQNFYANTHPSIGNYFMMTAGQIITNDDAFSGVVSDDNLARRMGAPGKSWRVYAESIPSTGYIGGDVYPYIKHHNPFAYFSDVRNDAAIAQNMVPFSQLSSDVAANRLPDFSFVIPNNYSNMHDCPPGMSTCTNAQKLAYGDAWLSSNIDPVLNSGALPSNTIVIITFDEAQTDGANGGGKIAAVFAGPRAKTTYQSTTFYQLQDLLGMFCSSLKLTACPGAGATAKNMAEMLK
jgi:phosphatidylinositol-3-phosphatase